MNTLLALVVGLILIVISTVVGLKLLKRWTGTTQLFADGAAITEDGIEFMPFPFTKQNAAFSEIESVEIIPWVKAMSSIMCLHHGLPVLEIRTRIFGDYVRVKLKPRPGAGTGTILNIFFSPRKTLHNLRPI